MGKTLAQDDGSVDVIVDARVFSLGEPPGTPERTLEHEALHVAIGQRGETLHDLRNRSDSPASAYGITLEVAGIACEEFRVERDWGIHTAPSPTSQLADFESTLRRFDAIVSSASQRSSKITTLNALWAPLALPSTPSQPQRGTLLRE